MICAKIEKMHELRMLDPQYRPKKAKFVTGQAKLLERLRSLLVFFNIVIFIKHLNVKSGLIFNMSVVIMHEEQK